MELTIYWVRQTLNKNSGTNNYLFLVYYIVIKYEVKVLIVSDYEGEHRKFPGVSYLADPF